MSAIHTNLVLMTRKQNFGVGLTIVYKIFDPEESIMLCACVGVYYSCIFAISFLFTQDVIFKHGNVCKLFKIVLKKIFRCCWCFVLICIYVELSFNLFPFAWYILLIITSNIVSKYYFLLITYTKLLTCSKTNRKTLFWVYISSLLKRCQHQHL